MPVKIACPKCQKQYQIPDNALGKPVQCRECGTQFRTRAPGQEVARQPSQQLQASGQTAAQPSASELAKLGIDGPMKKQADIFSSPPPRGALQSAIADPGFAEVSAGNVSDVFGDDENDDGMSAILNNPYATKPKKKKKSTTSSSGSSGSKKKRKKKRAASEEEGSSGAMELGVGFIMFALGVGLTVAGYLNASSNPEGGSYVLFYGLIIGGLGGMIKGAMRLGS